MPDFIIIGAQKGGTTAASYNLGLHPSIAVFSGVTEYGQQEIEFFNQHWERGGEWYRKQLPISNGGLRGEKTAELLHRKICHKRIYELAPEVKLIVFLRCPVARSYSQWRMASFVKGDEDRSFEDVIIAEASVIMSQNYQKHFYNLLEEDLSCWREGYLIKGFYYDQLRHLFDVFPRNQVHISISERVLKDSITEYNRIFDFLGVSSFSTNFERKFVGKKVSPIPQEIGAFLNHFYSEHNTLLFDLLGYAIPEWSE